MGKNIFFVVLISLFFINAHSQTKNRFAKEQTWELGGSFGFSSITTVHNGHSGNPVNNLSFHSYIGYFFLDGFEVGLIPGIDYYSQGTFNNSTYVIYLEPAYNFNANATAYPYIQAGIGYNILSTSYPKSYSGFAWDIEGGMKLNLFENCLLKIAFDYNEKTQNPENNNGERDGFNTFNFVVGFNVFFQ